MNKKALIYELVAIKTRTCKWFLRLLIFCSLRFIKISIFRGGVLVCIFTALAFFKYRLQCYVLSTRSLVIKDVVLRDMFATLLSAQRIIISIFLVVKLSYYQLSCQFVFLLLSLLVLIGVILNSNDKKIYIQSLTLILK